MGRQKLQPTTAKRRKATQAARAKEAPAHRPTDRPTDRPRPTACQAWEAKRTRAPLHGSLATEKKTTTKPHSCRTELLMSGFPFLAACWRRECRTQRPEGVKSLGPQWPLVAAPGCSAEQDSFLSSPNKCTLKNSRPNGSEFLGVPSISITSRHPSFKTDTPHPGETAGFGKERWLKRMGSQPLENSPKSTQTAWFPPTWSQPKK